MTRPRRRKGESIDWQAARERLARSEAAIAEATALSPERARAVMDERARSLARPLSDAAPPGELELLTFTIGRERYGIESRFVREVTRLFDLTPVPEAPAFVLGITNLRGEVLAVVDLRKLLGVADRGLTDLSRILVLGMVEPELGILADEVHAIEHLRAADVLEPPDTVSGIGREYLRGVTRDALIAIDGAVVLADKRLVVDEAESAPRP